MISQSHSTAASIRYEWDIRTGELDVPIGFKEDNRGNGHTSIGLAVVFGIGF